MKEEEEEAGGEDSGGGEAEGGVQDSGGVEHEEIVQSALHWSNISCHTAHSSWVMFAEAPMHGVLFCGGAGKFGIARNE